MTEIPGSQLNQFPRQFKVFQEADYGAKSNKGPLCLMCACNALITSSQFFKKENVEIGYGQGFSAKKRRQAAAKYPIH